MRKDGLMLLHTAFLTGGQKEIADELHAARLNGTALSETVVTRIIGAAEVARAELNGLVKVFSDYAADLKRPECLKRDEPLLASVESAAKAIHRLSALLKSLQSPQVVLQLAKTSRG